MSGVHCCRCCPLPFATQTWGALEIVRRSEMTFEEEDIDGVMASELASLFGADGVRGFSFREDDVSDDDAEHVAVCDSDTAHERQQESHGRPAGAGGGGLRHGGA